MGKNIKFTIKDGRAFYFTIGDQPIDDFVDAATHETFVYFEGFALRSAEIISIEITDK